MHIFLHEHAQFFKHVKLSFINMTWTPWSFLFPVRDIVLVRVVSQKHLSSTSTPERSLNTFIRPEMTDWVKNNGVIYGIEYCGEEGLRHLISVGVAWSNGFLSRRYIEKLDSPVASKRRFRRTETLPCPGGWESTSNDLKPLSRQVTWIVEQEHAIDLLLISKEIPYLPFMTVRPNIREVWERTSHISWWIVHHPQMNGKACNHSGVHSFDPSDQGPFHSVVPHGFLMTTKRRPLCSTAQKTEE